MKIHSDRGMLEFLFGLASLVLVAQMWDSLLTLPALIVDFRRWPPGSLLAINILVLVILIIFRSGSSKTSTRKLAIFWSNQHREAQSESSACDSDYESRLKRDVEWRKRARKRLPFT
jgi:hypothetical protein